MSRSDRHLRLCTTLLVCNLVFIWGNSLLPGEISGAISDGLKAFLEVLFPGNGTHHTGSGLLRKLAHFTEFASLGLLLAWRGSLLGKRPFAAFPQAVAAAILDETIQIFVPQRGPGVKDVCIDSCGAAVGIALLYLGHTYCKKKQTTILEEP